MVWPVGDGGDLKARWRAWKHGPGAPVHTDMKECKGAVAEAKEKAKKAAAEVNECKQYAPCVCVCVCVCGSPSSGGSTHIHTSTHTQCA